MLWVRYYVIPIDTKMEVENEDIIISTEYRGGGLSCMNGLMMGTKGV